MEADLSDLLVFTGNCQAQYLAAVFGTLEDTRTIFNGSGFGFTPSFGPYLAKSLHGSRFDEEIDSAIRYNHRIIHIGQTTAVRKAVTTSFTPAFTCMFPFTAFHAISPSEFSSFYGVKEPPSPSRIVEFDLGALMKCQTVAEFPVDIVGYVKENFRMRHLFNASTHPNGLVNKLLVEGILSQLSKIDNMYSKTNLVEAVSGHEGINFMTSLPLIPEVVRELDLNWCERDQELVRLIVLSKDDKEFSEDEAASYRSSSTVYGNDTQFWIAAARVFGRRGDTDLHINALKHIVNLSPGFNPFWADLFDAYIAFGNRAAAEDLLVQAAVQYGDRWEYGIVAAPLLRRLGRYQDSFDVASKFLHESNYFLHGIIPLADALVALNRRSAIQPYAQMVRDAHPYHASDIDSWMVNYGLGDSNPPLKN